MGRVRNPKVVEAHSEADIARAIKAYENKDFPNMKEAAAAYGVPYGTLYGRVKRGRQNRRDGHETQRVLTAPEEKVVVKEIEVYYLNPPQ